MSSLHEILRELDAYAERAGVQPSTVCRNATGNPRLRDRLERRIAVLEKDVRALSAYMKDNPPASAPEAEAAK